MRYLKNWARRTTQCITAVQCIAFSCLYHFPYPKYPIDETLSYIWLASLKLGLNAMIVLHSRDTEDLAGRKSAEALSLSVCSLLTELLNFHLAWWSQGHWFVLFLLSCYLLRISSIANQVLYDSYQNIKHSLFLNFSFSTKFFQSTFIVSHHISSFCLTTNNWLIIETIQGKLGFFY